MGRGLVDWIKKEKKKRKWGGRRGKGNWKEEKESLKIKKGFGNGFRVVIFRLRFLVRV